MRKTKICFRSHLLWEIGIIDNCLKSKFGWLRTYIDIYGSVFLPNKNVSYTVPQFGWHTSQFCTAVIKYPEKSPRRMLSNICVWTINFTTTFTWTLQKILLLCGHLVGNFSLQLTSSASFYNERVLHLRFKNNWIITGRLVIGTNLYE